MAEVCNSRQRLRPWLIKQLNDQTIPGLNWADNQRTQFRINWKHGGKQDYTRDEGLVFEAWAKYTGKYREHIDTPDPARWKTNLRCALNKAKDIAEVSYNKDDSNPFKIYKFLPPEKGPRRKVDFDPNAEIGDDDIPASVQQQKSSGSWARDSKSMDSSLKKLSSPMSGVQPVSDNTLQQIIMMDVDPDSTTGGGDVPMGWNIPLSQPNGPIPTFVEGVCHSTSTDEFTLPIHQALIQDVSNHQALVQDVSNHHVPVQDVPNHHVPVHDDIPIRGIQNMFLEQNHVNSFEYQLTYLDRVVDVRQLVGKNHIFYGHASLPEIFIEPLYGVGEESHTVHLPRVPDELKSNGHVDDVLELLESSQRGFVLRCDNGDIFLKRSCKVSIFYYDVIHKKTIKIPRDNNEVKIFDFMNFGQKYCFGPKIDPEVQIYIGQCGEPAKVNKLYIVARVKSVKAVTLVSQILSETENSIEKEISQSIENDRVFDCLVANSPPQVD